MKLFYLELKKNSLWIFIVKPLKRLYLLFKWEIAKLNITF